MQGLNQPHFKHAVQCILYYQEGEKLLIVMSIHVDNSMVAGRKEDLTKFYKKVRTRFNITELGTLSKYLGVRYEWYNDEDEKPCVKVTMKDTAEAFVRKYEECTGKKAKLAATPGYPNQVLQKNEGETVDIDNYRSLVGKLLFYIVKVGPDCANDSLHTITSITIIHYRQIPWYSHHVPMHSLALQVASHPTHCFPVFTSRVRHVSG